ncbi:MAG: branched-chain amino acid ABC transporter permease [Deltaproteobacteria bacterium]|nr:branched-chain amino acid ABC transporter permease [Deltaproteobacteria bacterium]
MKKSLLIGLVIMALGLVVPSVTDSEYYLHLFVLAAMFGVLAVYWNLLDGYLGLIHFGYAAFFALGAYTSALVTTRLGWPLLPAFAAGGVVAAVIGGLIIIPCLRMGSYATAIVTLAFAEIMRITATSWTALTKGEMGLWGIPPIFEGAGRTPYVYLITAILAAAVVVLSLIVRSYTGLAYVAIKDDETAAATTGIPVKRIKLTGTMVSCGVAGVVGAFYAHYILTITPALFGIAYTIQIMAMSLFGGKGTLLGPLLGAAVLLLMGEGFRFMENYRLIMYGLVIIATVMLFPEGLIGVVKRGGRLVSRRSGS